jgi:MSHA biogenesis protein MshK
MVKRCSLCLAIVAALTSSSAWPLHDPTRPIDPRHYFGSGSVGETPTWTLQSILSSAERRVAVINGVSVREGDRIGAAHVMSIRPEAVVLRTDHRTVTLRLWPEGIKKVNP